MFVRVRVEDFILAKCCYSQQLHREFSAGQSYGNSPMRLLNRAGYHANLKGLIQVPSRRTGNNAALEKCLTSCNGETLGQAPLRQ